MFDYKNSMGPPNQIQNLRASVLYISIFYVPPKYLARVVFEEIEF